MNLTTQQHKELNDKLSKAQNLLNEISQILTAEQPRMVRIEEPHKKITKPSIQIKKLIDFWNISGVARHPNPEAKAYQDLVKRLKKFLNNGTFFNEMDCYKAYHNYKFTSEEITEGIRRFTLMATNPDYDPPDGSYKDYLKKLNFFNFLYNGHAKTIKSYFIHCLENEPELLARKEEIIIDERPQLTLSIKHIFSKEILGGITASFSDKQENDFKKSSNRLVEFYKKNKNNLNNMAFSGVNESVDIILGRMLVKSVIDSIGEQNITKITTGYLCSDLTFTQRFPAYLNNQGITKRR